MIAKAPPLLLSTPDEVVLDADAEEAEPLEGPETRAVLARFYAARSELDLDSRSGEADLSSVALGLERLREMEAEPVMFQRFSRAVFAPANFLFEGFSYLVMPDTITVSGMKVFDRTGREDLATVYGRTLLKREINFLADLNDSHLTWTNVERGAEEIDTDRLRRLQNRIFFDSFKRAYKERYQLPAFDLDTMLSTFSSGDWMDFIVVPAVVSLVAAKQGVERKIRLGDDVRIELNIEPGTRVYKMATDSEHGGRLAGVAVNFFDLPFSPMMTVDSLEDGIGVGFAGIGTDLGAVLETLDGFTSSRDRD